ncbi:MAG: hypothetical protein ACREP7_20170 [Lysobacter sp.]
MADKKPVFLPPQIAALLRADRKIEAIKRVLDSNPGMDLRTAKDAVEAFARKIPAGSAVEQAVEAFFSSAPASKTGFPEAAKVALQHGQMIVAIKIVREAYGLDLRAAKNLVEAYAKNGEAALTGLNPSAGSNVARQHRSAIGDSGRTVAPGDSNNGGVWLAALLVTAGVAAVWYLIA